MRYWEREDWDINLARGLPRENKKRPYFRIGCLAVLILFVIFSLLLFWPVRKPITRVKAKKPRRLVSGPEIAGQSKYKVVSAKQVPSIGYRAPSWKAVYLVLSFEATNLAEMPMVLDHSRFLLKDKEGTEYPADLDTTEYLHSVYQIRGLWGSKLGPGATASAWMVFSVPRNAQGLKFVCRDLDWRSPETVEIDLGI